MMNYQKNLITMDSKNILLQESGNIIPITELTKAVLIFGEAWLVLVSHIINKDGNLRLFRHASYDFIFDAFYLNDKPKPWGDADDIRFYSATDEQRKFFIKKLTEKGYRFVKPLNKLIER